MFNGNTMLFAANEPQNEALANPVSIKGLSIHITVGSADSLLPTAQDMVALLKSLKIPHDPLETIKGVGHDLGGLQAATKRSNYQFASDSFAVIGDLKGVGR